MTRDQENTLLQHNCSARKSNISSGFGEGKQYHSSPAHIAQPR